MYHSSQNDAILQYRKRLNSLRKKRNLALLFAFGLAGWLFLQSHFYSDSPVRNRLIVIGILFGFFEANRLAVLSDKHIKKLYTTKDIDMLPLVLDFLDKDTSETRQQGEYLEFVPVSVAESNCLLRLLPKLDSANISTLNSRQAARLYRILTIEISQEMAKLIIAVLEMAERTRDTRALPFIEKLTADRTVYQAKKDGDEIFLKLSPLTHQQERIYKMAKRCEPLLREQLEKEQAQQSLLRTADEPACSSDELLKPVTASNHLHNAQELLRISQEN